MTTAEDLPLDVPTDATETGPIVHVRKPVGEGLVTVDYDHQTSDGSIVWARLEFQDALYVDYRDGACLRAEDIVGNHIVKCRDPSDHLEDVIRAWEEAVGSQGYHQARGGRGRFTHFTVYFDDTAALNVVAAECRLVQLPEGWLPAVTD